MTDHFNAETMRDSVDGHIVMRRTDAAGGENQVEAFGESRNLLTDDLDVIRNGGNLLDFDELYVGDAVYSDDSDSFNDIWSDNVVIAFVPNASEGVPRSYYQPAFAYTLRKKNNPVVDTYTEGGKVEIIRNTDIFVPKVVGSDAGYLINDTNA